MADFLDVRVRCLNVFDFSDLFCPGQVFTRILDSLNPGILLKLISTVWILLVTAPREDIHDLFNV